jgi:hypothetical protein
MVFLRPQEGQEKVTAPAARWDAMREPISVLAVGHPSPLVRRMADELSIEARRSLNRVSWLIVDLVRTGNSPTQAMLDRQKKYDKVVELVGHLREALHTSG